MRTLLIVALLGFWQTPQQMKEQTQTLPQPLVFTCSDGTPCKGAEQPKTRLILPLDEALTHYIEDHCRVVATATFTNGSLVIASPMAATATASNDISRVYTIGQIKCDQ